MLAFNVNGVGGSMDIPTETTDDEQSDGARLCEICGRRYDYSGSLTLPMTGYSGYLICDAEDLRCICACEKCLNSIQDVINLRYDGRLSRHG